MRRRKRGHRPGPRPQAHGRLWLAPPRLHRPPRRPHRYWSRTSRSPFGARGTLLAEHPNLRVAAVDVDLKVGEVLDQVVEILRLQLVDVERDALAGHGRVDLVA